MNVHTECFVTVKVNVIRYFFTELNKVIKNTDIYKELIVKDLMIMSLVLLKG